jgi:hypothetical protein
MAPRIPGARRDERRTTLRARLARVAQITVRVTGPVQVLVGIAFWLGRAVPLRPAHMAVGMLFDLAFLTLVVLAALAGFRRTTVFAGVALAVAIPLFGVVQARILPGSAHWVVRSVHLLLGVLAMLMAARLARFIRLARLSAELEPMLRPTEFRDPEAARRAVG